MNNIKAVIFDMDGLLIDSERLALIAFVTICEQYGIEGLEEVIKECIGTNPYKTKELLTPHVQDYVNYDQFRQEWDAKYHQMMDEGQLELKPGAKALLTHLRELALPIALATSTDTKKAEKKLRQTGILDFFLEIVGGDQVSNSKPHPQIYQHTAQKLNICPTQCLALEDSHNGVKAAHAAGMVVIQIPDLVPPSEEIKALGHRIMDSLTEVIDIDLSN